MIPYIIIIATFLVYFTESQPCSDIYSPNSVDGVVSLLGPVLLKSDARLAFPDPILQLPSVIGQPSITISAWIKASCPRSSCDPSTVPIMGFVSGDGSNQLAFQASYNNSNRMASFAMIYAPTCQLKVRYTSAYDNWSMFTLTILNGVSARIWINATEMVIDAKGCIRAFTGLLSSTGLWVSGPVSSASPQYSMFNLRIFDMNITDTTVARLMDVGPFASNPAFIQGSGSRFFRAIGDTTNTTLSPTGQLMLNGPIRPQLELKLAFEQQLSFSDSDALRIKNQNQGLWISLWLKIDPRFSTGSTFKGLVALRAVNNQSLSLLIQQQTSGIINVFPSFANGATSICSQTPRSFIQFPADGAYHQIFLISSVNSLSLQIWQFCVDSALQCSLVDINGGFDLSSSSLWVLGNKFCGSDSSNITYSIRQVRIKELPLQIAAVSTEIALARSIAPSLPDCILQQNGDSSAFPYPTCYGFGSLSKSGTCQCSQGRSGKYCRTCDSSFTYVPSNAGILYSRCQCSAGSENINNTCTSCNPGYYNSFVNSPCLNCSSPNGANLARTACHLCPISKYANSTTGNCQFCSSGTVTSTIGRASCDVCPAGTFSDEGRRCTNCPPGSVSNSGMGTCTPCPPGTQATVNTCVPCPRGTYNNDSSLACTRCPNDMISTANGTSCIDCGLGMYFPTIGDTNCSLCPSGWSKSALDPTCRRCDSGTVSSDNRTQCAVCGPGFFTVNSDRCAPCQVGYISSSNGTTNCTICPLGKFSSPDWRSCLDCSEGSTSNSDRSGCTLCPVGTYSSKPASPLCLACAPGTIANTTGLTKCDPCPLGTSSPREGSSSCTVCSTSSFSNNYGSTNCTSCQSNSESDRIGSSTQNQCLCSSQYFHNLSANSDGFQCDPCIESFICDKTATIIPGTRQGYYRDTADPYMVLKCFPAEACLESAQNTTTQCLPLYTGRRCSHCSPSSFRISKSCQECGHSWLGIAAMIMMLIMACILFLFIAKPSKNPLIGISIALQNLQLISVFGVSVTDHWSPTAHSSFSIISILNYNLEIFRAECSVSLSYWSKQAMQLISPLLAVLLLACLALVYRTIQERLNRGSFSNSSTSSHIASARNLAVATSHISQNSIGHELDKNRGQSRSIFDRLIYACILLMLNGYTILVSTACNPFNCYDAGHGQSYIKTDPSVPCSGSDYSDYVQVSMGALVVYAIGIPFTVGMIVAYHYRRCTIVTESFANRFGALTAPYNAQCYWWEVVNLLRRLFIILTINLIQAKFMQLFATLALLFAYVILQTFYNPYKTTQENRLSIMWNSLTILILFSAGVIEAGGARSEAGTSILEILIFVSMLATVMFSLYIVSLEAGIHSNGSARSREKPSSLAWAGDATNETASIGTVRSRPTKLGSPSGPMKHFNSPSANISYFGMSDKALMDDSVARDPVRVSSSLSNAITAIPALPRKTYDASVKETNKHIQ